ncbi:MAG: hypothetical protein LBQ81_01200 [Zoogloeaceae bacterium]|jgi:hypothetical protein|nr:hypothetical protein [Zoogloeaceae bacterium]
MHTQESNRLDVAREVLQANIARHLEWLDQEKKRLARQMRQHIDQYPDMKDKQTLLTRLPLCLTFMPQRNTVARSCCRVAPIRCSFMEQDQEASCVECRQEKLFPAPDRVCARFCLFLPRHEYWQALGDAQRNRLMAGALLQSPDIRMAETRVRHANLQVMAQQGVIVDLRARGLSGCRAFSGSRFGRRSSGGGR